MPNISNITTKGVTSKDVTQQKQKVKLLLFQIIIIINKQLNINQPEDRSYIQASQRIATKTHFKSKLHKLEVTVYGQSISHRRSHFFNLFYKGLFEFTFLHFCHHLTHSFTPVVPQHSPPPHSTPTEQHLDHQWDSR